MKISLLITTLIATIALFITSSARSAVGDIILWPVITGVEFRYDPGKIVNINATVDMIAIRQTRTSAVTSNTLIFSLISTSGAWIHSAPYMPKGMPWQEASDYWLKKYGMHTVINLSQQWFFTGDFGIGGCVGLTMHNANMSGTGGAFADLNVYNPGPTYLCTNIPISAYRCNITQDLLAIDYGRINADEANGKSASINFDMNCDGPVTVNITSTTGTSVALGSGISAALSIDDIPVGKNMTIAAGNSTHKLSAILSAPSVNAGVYNASTALIVNYL